MLAFLVAALSTPHLVDLRSSIPGMVVDTCCMIIANSRRQSFANAVLSGHHFWRDLLRPHGQRSAVSVPVFFSFPEIRQSCCQPITDTWSALVNILTADATAMLEEWTFLGDGWRFSVYLIGHDPYCRLQGFCGSRSFESELGLT